ncbi:MAG TPA: DUF2252 family protein [Verrucomicrobiae bacterium]|nr:DUF2252 family protein [Verrucomicrobiae bacterium]
MTITQATRKYEAWLSNRLTLLAPDLHLKRRAMRQGVLPFLRATFYRWCQRWPEMCPKEANAVEVLAIGDLHVENFGTWRDEEGRLVWGINDFDEVAFMPYTMDLVRLATSARLAFHEGHLELAFDKACDSILEGYTASLKSGGLPIVLGEHHHWLRELATSELRDPARFWEKMTALPTWKTRVPKGAARGLERLMPEGALNCRIVHRVAGLGSLGRERYVVIGDWHGGKIAREAKALTTSAYVWAAKRRDGSGVLYQQALDQAVRCRDPYVRLQGRWIIRRLAPDCSRVELASLPNRRDESRLLYEMGWETANVHLGSKKAVRKILADLRKRPANWLRHAAEAMARATTADWNEWKKSTTS